MFVGVLGISVGSTLAVFSSAQAQTAPPAVKASAAQCSSIVDYQVTPGDPGTSGTGTRLGLWFRSDGTTDWTPTDAPAQELTALSGEVETGLKAGPR